MRHAIVLAMVSHSTVLLAVALVTTTALCHPFRAPPPLGFAITILTQSPLIVVTRDCRGWMTGRR
jgi:hypothetical protein